MIVYHHRHAANFYASGGIERAHLLRSDADALRKLLARADARVVPVWRQRNLVLDSTAEKTAPPGPAFLSVPEFQALFADIKLDPEGSAVLLGFVDDAPHFAIDLSLLAEPEIQARIQGLNKGGAPRFADLRDVGPLIGHQPGAVMAYARGLTFWHERHKFCGVCGSPTVAAEAGHVRRCTNEACKAQHFPRTDPAVIMLVTDGKRVLLGRQKIWPPGQHSVLAGFVEPGESLEDAVAREVEEEVGLKVRDIRYHSSQPWPFPASIMLGFTAMADPVEPKVNTDELETARWFTRAEIRSCPENDIFRLPRRVSVSRRLIEDWAKGE
ncbi:MAG: NAD(+) diphosphatase [Alphaproteobacteria bacterium]|nr:NAD(+) diphosphatase [Alphaproteobacteria bacterium]